MGLLMEINYQELKQVVENIKFEYYEHFSYNGLGYILFPCEYTEEERLNGDCPFFYINSDLADLDIYFANNFMDPKFNKPILLHEILEASLLNILDGDYSTSLNKAHEIANKFDDKYAREIFDDKTYEDYCSLKKKMDELSSNRSQN
jgi:hypothetical protein